MIRVNPFDKHLLKLLRKRISRTIITPLIRSLNQRNHTSVIIVEYQDTLIQIAINGLLLKLLRKRISRTIITPLIRSLNQRNHTSVITVENRDTLFQIAINGLLLNKTILCHPLEAKINSKILWLLLENFWKLFFFNLISMSLILPLIHLSKGLRIRKFLFPPKLLFGRKKTPLSDSFTHLVSRVLLLFWVNLVFIAF